MSMRIIIRSHWCDSQEYRGSVPFSHRLTSDEGGSDSPNSLSLTGAGCLGGLFSGTQPRLTPKSSQMSLGKRCSPYTQAASLRKTLSFLGF